MIHSRLGSGRACGRARREPGPAETIEKAVTNGRIVRTLVTACPYTTSGTLETKGVLASPRCELAAYAWGESDVGSAQGCHRCGGSGRLHWPGDRRPARAPRRHARPEGVANAHAHTHTHTHTPGPAGVAVHR